VSRFLLVFALSLLFVVVPAAPAAPVPKHLMKPGPELYYPTRLGTKWAYEEDKCESHVAITRVEMKDGAFHITETHTRKVDSAKRTLTIMVSEKGVFRTSVNDHKDDPPLCWLKLPVKPGERWYGGDWFTAADLEDIETPAGKFRAIPVTHESDGNFIALLPGPSYTRWFAPGVGLIRQRCGQRDQFILKSFTPVKD
jgi:hypothetical protein